MRKPLRELNILKTGPFMIITIIILTLSAYSFAVHDSFKTMDDFGSIIDNEMIKNFSYIDDIFKSSFFGKQAYYRPLVQISFMLEYHLFGLNPFWYYLDNILIHIGSAILLFFVIKRMFDSQVPAFFVALLFALHPIQWEAVSNIPGRAILLCGFFIIKSFHFFIISERKPKSYYTSILFFSIALLCKESAVVFPVLLLSYRLLLKSEEGIKRNLIIVLPFFFLNGVYFVIRRLLGITKLFYWNSIAEAFFGFITFLRSVITHLRLFILPVDLHFDRSAPLFTSIFDPVLIFTILFFAGAVTAIYKFRNSISRRAMFFILWFCIELISVSQIVVTIGVQPGRISTADHFVYLASIGIFALAVMGFDNLLKINKNKKFIDQKLFIILTASVFIFFFLMTVQNNIYSSNEIAMFERSLEINPDNTRIRNSLAYAYAKLNKFEKAEFHFRRSLEVLPDDGWALVGLGKSLVDQGKLSEGLQVYERTYDAGVFKDVHQENLKATYKLLKEKYEEMLAGGADDYQIHYSLGVVYSKLGKIEKAIFSYKRSLSLNPEFKNSLFNLASILEARGEVDKAIDYFEQLLALDSEKDEMDKFVYTKLADIYENLGDIEKSEEYKELAESCDDVCPAE